jgi:hypothetical protein
LQSICEFDIVAGSPGRVSLVASSGLFEARLWIVCFLINYSSARWAAGKKTRAAGAPYGWTDVSCVGCAWVRAWVVLCVRERRERQYVYVRACVRRPEPEPLLLLRCRDWIEVWLRRVEGGAVAGWMAGWGWWDLDDGRQKHTTTGYGQ